MEKSSEKPRFGYTVVYVENVDRSVEFYERAFGFTVRRLDKSHRYIIYIYAKYNHIFIVLIIFLYNKLLLFRWGELESGETTIAFTPLHQHETEDLTGVVQKADSGRQRAPLEVCFTYDDVDAAFKVYSSYIYIYSMYNVFDDDDVSLGNQSAVANGAVAVSEPEEKEWGQKVGYVRDINGIVVRLGSHVRPHTHH